MRNFLQRLKTEKERTAFYALSLLVILAYHVLYDLSYGDMVSTYGGILARGSEYLPEDRSIWAAILDYSYSHYMTWSSRNIIEACMIVIGRLPNWMYMALDVALDMQILWCMDELTGMLTGRLHASSGRYLLLGLFAASYPMCVMSTAGWVATTMNYTWVLAAGLYVAVACFRLVERDDNVHDGRRFVPSYLLALAASFYAFNHELFAGFFFIFFITLLIYILTNNALRDEPAHLKLNPAAYAFPAIDVIELIFIARCPGNSARRIAEANDYLMEYFGYSIWQKLEEGLICLLKTLRYAWPTALILAAILIAALIQAAGSRDTQGEDRRLSDRLPELILIAGSLTAGLATRVILGFSLAFMLSGERTSIFLVFDLMLIGMAVYEKRIAKGADELPARSRWLKPACLLLIAVLVLNNLLMIHSGVRF